jgi:hypothetical protein
MHLCWYAMRPSGSGSGPPRSSAEQPGSAENGKSLRSLPSNRTLPSRDPRPPEAGPTVITSRSRAVDHFAVPKDLPDGARTNLGGPDVPTTARPGSAAPLVAMRHRASATRASLRISSGYPRIPQVLFGAEARHGRPILAANSQRHCGRARHQQRALALAGRVAASASRQCRRRRVRLTALARPPSVRRAGSRP